MIAFVRNRKAATTKQHVHRNITTLLLNADRLSCYNYMMQTVIRNRSASGQFTPGFSGNSGGRPRDEHRVADLARSHISEAKPFVWLLCICCIGQLKFFVGFLFILEMVDKF